MNRAKFRYRLIALASMLAIAQPINALSDEGAGVNAMCLPVTQDQAVCDCASKALGEQLNADDFKLYDAIGADYMARREKGEDMAAAWSAASDAQAERLGEPTTGLLKRTNAAGRAHRAAIKDCAS